MKKFKKCERKKGIAPMQYFLNIAWDMNPNDATSLKHAGEDKINDLSVQTGHCLAVYCPMNLRVFVFCFVFFSRNVGVCTL
jgi:hypothetical protein